jgi:hypothetical protein
VTDWFSGLPSGGASYADRKTSLQNQWTAAGLPMTDLAVYVDGNEITTNLESQGQGRTVSVEDIPLADTIVAPSSGPPAGWAQWRHMDVDLDPTTGLITAVYGPTQAAWNDTTGDFGIIEPYMKYNYVIEPITDTPPEWDRGPGDVTGMVFYGDIPWVYREHDIAAGFKNFRWMPPNVADSTWLSNLPMLARDILWPAPEGDAIEIDDIERFLGTILCDVETGSIAFKAGA